MRAPLRRRPGFRTCASTAAALLLCAGACGSDARGGDTARRSADGPLVVFNAGSLARPLRAVLDSFARREGVRIEQENAGSLEIARKVTELGRVPDVIALADHEVFPNLLMPGHVAWYARFARNRMVLAHTARSRGATEIDSTNWHRVVRGTGTESGQSDPDLDPAGYRALLLFQLAERHYGQPGLADSLRRSVHRRNIRPKSADLIALLQAGELDYAWMYESVARAAELPHVTLPRAIDLSDPTHAAEYAAVQVRVLGSGSGDSLTIRGEPIVYGVSIPNAAPHPALAERFVSLLLSADGQRILRAAQLDALDTPIITGASPAFITGAAARERDPHP
jgi:molybdate/tungstate transport system substrate-binding protein